LFLLEYKQYGLQHIKYLIKNDHSILSAVFHHHFIIQIIILLVIAKNFDVKEHINTRTVKQVEWARDHPVEHQVIAFDTCNFESVNELTQVNVWH
jgi:hypothetical protein